MIEFLSSLQLVINYMFIFKKIFSQLLFPLPLIFYFSLFGLFLLWFTEKQKLGKIVVSMSISALLVLSYAAVPDGLLTTLEKKYKHFLLTKQPLKEKESAGIHRNIKHVVVLGGGHTFDPNLPLTG
ncbi:MAG: hypothetical protein D3923_03090, partial [Candidatus Electrothrix sp. AR3]|nr:hypothetical protein [Candidatus Electrothrix sp. AR3]